MARWMNSSLTPPSLVAMLHHKIPQCRFKLQIPCHVRPKSITTAAQAQHAVKAFLKNTEVKRSTNLKRSCSRRIS